MVVLPGCDAIVRDVESTPRYQLMVHYAAGKRDYDAGRYVDALSEFNKALDADPKYLPALQFRAGIDLRLHNLDAAVADGKRIDAIMPTGILFDHARAVNQRLLGSAYGLERKYSDAEKYLRASIAKSPGDAGSYALLAEALFYQGKVATAIDATSHAISIAPLTVYYNNRCFYEAGSGNPSTALVDCNYAIGRRDNAYVFAHDSRALAYLRLDQPAKALADCYTALAIASHNPNSLFLKGIAEERLGQGVAGRRDIAAAVALKPSLPATYRPFDLNNQ